MRNKALAPNINNGDLVNYPNGRIQDNTGSGNGTPVNELIYGDIHEMMAKMMRLYGISYNGLPDNETNGYQSIEALRAIASKNDFVTSLTSNGTIVSVGLKLNFMLTNEQVICKAGFDLGSETQIQGSNGNTYTLTKIGNFKTDEYVRLIRTASGVTLVRLVDLVNLDLAVSEFLYLKKASQAQENDGTTDIVATTPLTNKTVFERRVNGVDSSTYLATPSQNGLLSAEDKVIIDNIGASPIKNKGTASGIDIDSGTIGANYAVTGDIVSCTLTANPGDSSVFRVVVSNALADTNYLVKIFVQSLSADINDDNDIGCPVFKPINTTTFDFSIKENKSISQNLKIHFEVVKY